MKTRKIKSSVALALALVLLTPDKAAFADASNPNMFISFVDDGFLGGQTYLQPANMDVNQCGNSKCEQSGGPSGYGTAYYRPCESPQEMFCLEGLSITSTWGASKTANFYANSCGANKSIMLNQGKMLAGSTSIWSTSDGKFYAIEAFSKLHWNPSESLLDSLELGVAPVRKMASKLDSNIGGVCTDKEPMVWSEFDAKVRLEISVRVPDNLGGFYMGRVAEAKISQTNSINGARKITISGKPEIVPKLSLIAPKNEVPLSLRNGADGVAIPDYTGLWYKEPSVVETVDWAIEKSGNKATKYQSAWRIYSQSSSTSTYSKCVGKVPDLLGWGTTNAMFYDSTPPEFKNSTLDFKVAGTHYDISGTKVLTGNYELRLSSTFARCLYKLSKQPVYASVSAVNDGNEKVVSTTTVSEKNGWLTLDANALTFSRKTIRLKLSNSKAKVNQKVGSKIK